MLTFRERPSTVQNDVITQLKKKKANETERNLEHTFVN